MFCRYKKIPQSAGSGMYTQSCIISAEHIAFSGLYLTILTLILLTWRIWWVPNNARKWQMGFNWRL